MTSHTSSSDGVTHLTTASGRTDSNTDLEDSFYDGVTTKTRRRDENPIRTLGDYSKPSHEGYRNTIELPEGNNVVPLRSDTIRLVQNGCSFHGFRSEDPNQHLKDFLKLVDSLDLDGENRERMRLRLFQFSLRDQASNWLERLPTGSISTWEDLTTRFLAQFFPSGRTTKLRNDILMFQQHHGESLSEAWTPSERLRKLKPNEAWDTIERLAQYENEGWNDTFTSDEASFSYENPNVEQLLKIMVRKVDTLMKDAISLMGSSEGLFRLTTNKMCQPPTDPSRQEEFEHIVMNFIYDQEERINQLENYMQDITDEFIEFSSEPRVMAEEEEDDVDDEGVRGDAGHGEAKGSTDLYRNMSQGDWQAHQAHWMGQQDERWGRLDTWMGQ
ncbi:zinc finger, CCHC-type containing protein [Tanacetum coccineum]